MAAAILKAFDDGLSRQLDPGEPEQRNIYEAMEDGKQVKKLPMSLGEALDCLATDEVIQSALSGEMYRLYDQYKRDEWERFLATTSNWDMENYMDCLP
jgi:glutamine synthetase